MVIFLLAQLEPGPVLDFAETLEREGDSRQAAAEFYRFWTYWPSDSLAPYALFRAGINYARAGEFPIALRVFSEYTEEGLPKSEYALLEMARIRLLTREPGADTLISTLDSILPTETSLMRAWAALTQDDPSSAKAILLRAGEDSLAQLLEGFPEGPTPLLAGCLSALVPGAGQVYYAHPGDAFMAFIFSVGMAGISYYYFKAERQTPALITGGLAGFFWLGGAYGAYVGARARRHEKREGYLLEIRPLIFKDPYNREFFR
ncbi:MAG: hypothetical protein ABIM74_08150 [candidate division WOR-3 bacterium]